MALPIGISFYTFESMSYTIGVYRRLAKPARRFSDISCFVSLFPHLVAGPIVRYNVLAERIQYLEHTLDKFSTGVAIFILGFAKKILLANPMGRVADAVFGAAAPLPLDAWVGVIAYAFQIYFDFCGYSDMAIGLDACLIRDTGERPVTLSFRKYYGVLVAAGTSRYPPGLRDYLYLPLGGNRKGRARRYVNLFATMLLGGLWHGAGWTYVFWGGLHGLYLCINHAWQALAGERQLPRGVAAALTFLSVVVAWVFFRATNFTTAVDILKGMAGLHGVALPDAIVRGLGPLGTRLTGLGIEAYLGGGQRFVQNWSWVALGALIAFVMPNTQEFHARLRPALEPVRAGWLRWRPNAAWAIGLGALAAAGILSLSRPSEFLYFQF